MERVPREIDARHPIVGHLDRLRILSLVKFSSHRETGIGRRCGDELNDRSVAAQRFTPPVHGDDGRVERACPSRGSFGIEARHKRSLAGMFRDILRHKLNLTAQPAVFKK
jgi:hypothetical protein